MVNARLLITCDTAFYAIIREKTVLKEALDKTFVRICNRNKERRRRKVVSSRPLQ